MSTHYVSVCVIIITCELYSRCSLSDGCNRRPRAQPSSSDLSFVKQHNAVMTRELVGRTLTSGALKKKISLLDFEAENVSL